MVVRFFFFKHCFCILFSGLDCCIRFGIVINLEFYLKRKEKKRKSGFLFLCVLCVVW